MPGLNLIHVNKGVPWWPNTTRCWLHSARTTSVYTSPTWLWWSGSYSVVKNTMTGRKIYITFSWKSQICTYSIWMKSFLLLPPLSMRWFDIWQPVRCGFWIHQGAKFQRRIPLVQLRSTAIPAKRNRTQRIYPKTQSSKDQHLCSVAGRVNCEGSNHHLKISFVLSRFTYWDKINQHRLYGLDNNYIYTMYFFVTYYSNWYQYWGCGELPRSLMRQQWPKLRYQFLFYPDETKLMMNKQILSI